jgi:hypothetical protein
MRLLQLPEVIRVELQLRNLVFDVRSILGEQAKPADGKLGVASDIQVAI